MTNAEKFKTTEERAKEFEAFCSERICEACPLKQDCSVSRGQFAWLELEAEEEEEKTLPCPFCGGEVTVHRDAPEEWVSCYCGYSSKMMNHGCSIAAHNLVARAVMVLDRKKEEK